MPTAKVVRNIQQNVYAADLGTVVVIYDLVETAVENETPDEEREFWEGDIQHPRSVKTLHSVELQLFDKIGVDITGKMKSTPFAEDMLKGKLLSMAAQETLEELGTVEDYTEDDKMAAAMAFVNKAGGRKEVSRA